MEKAKLFLFYHGEKVALALVVVLCLLGLLVAHPWPTAAPQDAGLKQELGRLEAKVKTGAPAAQQFAHADFVAELVGQLSPATGVQPFAAAVWPTVDIAELPGDRQNYPRLASVAQVQVLPERGGLKVTWSADPQKQAVENAQARYEGVIELVQAVIYRATAEAPNQLQELGTVPLENVVIVPAATSPTGRPRPERFVGGPPRPQPGAALLAVPEGKVAAEEAEQAGRFCCADRAVKADQDYVYKVKLVAKNPRYDPTIPASVPELIESDVQATALSLAQRPLPSIRWFFMGGNTEQASVRVYKWHVLSVPAGPALGGAATAGARPSTGAPAVTPAGTPSREERDRMAREARLEDTEIRRRMERDREQDAANERARARQELGELSAGATPAGTAAAPPAVTRPAVAAVAPVGGPTPAGGAAAGAQEMVEHGEWAMENFSVRPGDLIGRPVQRYFSLGGVGKPEQLTIDFATGCTAVAVDMVLRISDAPQVTLTAAGAPSSDRLIKDSLLLYYIDPTGALRTRWQEPDLVLAEEQAGPALSGAAPAGARPSTGAPAAEPGGTTRISEEERVRMGRAAARAEEEEQRRRQARDKEQDVANERARLRAQEQEGF